MYCAKLIVIPESEKKVNTNAIEVHFSFLANAMSVFPGPKLNRYLQGILLAWVIRYAVKKLGDNLIKTYFYCPATMVGVFYIAKDKEVDSAKQELKSVLLNRIGHFANAFMRKFLHENLDEIISVETSIDSIPMDQGVAGTCMDSPDDKSKLWAYLFTGRGIAWDAGCKGASKAPIAVLDSGIDPESPALGVDCTIKLPAGCKGIVNVAGSEDYGRFTLNKHSDNHGHGTSVAVLLAGRGKPVSDYSEGAGMLPQAKLVGIQVSYNTSVASNNLIEGLCFARMHKAKMIVIAIQFSKSTPAMNAMLNSLGADRDILVVAAAGNGIDGKKSKYYPAAHEDVVSVGGITLDGHLWPCNANSKIDILAPAMGVWLPRILAKHDGQNEGYRDGTSFSAPIAAGAIMLAHEALTQVWEKKQGWFRSKKAPLLRESYDHYIKFLREKGIVLKNGDAEYPLAKVDEFVKFVMSN